MTDYVWPYDLVPYAQSFYLQPHTGGTESPFSRQTKVYGLSAPRWVCSMSFRGGFDGTLDQAAFGPRLDALITKLKGRQNRIAIYDFRRPLIRTKDWVLTASNEAAALGATSMVITGLAENSKIHAGDYLGGDGRPHIITDDAVCNSLGKATVTFEPPLVGAIAAGDAVFGNPTGLFRLVDDDAGQNGVAVGELVNMALNFVEDL
jgi:hypothetical protein